MKFGEQLIVMVYRVCVINHNDEPVIVEAEFKSLESANKFLDKKIEEEGLYNKRGIFHYTEILERVI